MFKLKTASILAAICFAAAAQAGEVPREKNFPATAQEKAMSVQHWKVIADDLVSTLISSLGNTTERGLYFSASSASSAFEKELHKFMVDSAVAKGAKVYSRPNPSALSVDLSTVVLTHRSAAQALDMPATLLASGVLVLREVAIESWQAGVLAAGLLRDAERNLAKAPSRSEFAVTVSVEDQGIYLMRKTNIYYVDSADAQLFSRPVGRTFQLEAVK